MSNAGGVPRLHPFRRPSRFDRNAAEQVQKELALDVPGLTFPKAYLAGSSEGSGNVTPTTLSRCHSVIIQLRA